MALDIGFKTYSFTFYIKSNVNIRENILNFFGKESYQFITIKEFAEYSGIEEEIVNKYLIN
ncbi:hypothetical protein DS884_17915 [Tenacibaculum sp. E3R01]|nr:hypothetical protein DS884_17915 [Tenacibaculum sp. E3R01]